MESVYAPSEICPWKIPQTNADRIRSMSDDELAEFLIDFSTRKAIKAVNQAFVTRQGVADWLKQEMEG